MQEHDNEPLADVPRVAKQLNVPESWVYSHAKTLGALKVGNTCASNHQLLNDT